MRNEFVLNVCTFNFEDMSYNLKRDGWLNNFVDAKNQSMREDEVPWRGAREKCPEFFSIFLFVLTDKDDIIMNWQCGVGMFIISLLFFSLFSNILLSFVIVSLSIHSHFLTFAHLDVLGGSIIACRSIQCHIVAMESDIDIYKSILLPVQKHTAQHIALQRGSVSAPPP